MNQPYLQLKLSWEIFRKAPDALAAPEQQKLQTLTHRQALLERRILASPEAASVVIPSLTLHARVQEIRNRYDSEDSFEHDLARTGLNRNTLQEAISCDLRVETTLEKIASAAEAATVTDAEIFYRLNPEAFDQPEIRTLRHILLTWESASERADAAKLLDRLRTESASADAFAKAALRYSQCPTAMEGGVLGQVKRGVLYAELEEVAFALAENTVSAVTASPIGLHILRCDAIQPGGMMSFDSVRERIIERLNDQRRAALQRAWIKQLPPVLQPA